MSSKILPKQIEPLALAEHNSQLNGLIPLADMTRLIEALITAAGNAQVSLKFAKDKDGQPCLSGSIKVTLKLKCQRCLQPMDFNLDTLVQLGIVANEQAAKTLPDYYEPLVIPGEAMLLAEIIEDEILLRLPLVVKHDAKDCAIDLQKFSKTGDNDAPKKPNPFQALAKLKGKSKK